ncbi:DNA internalization-related competence protein ComEC/Rec2 [Enterobacillus tribolii]|uniref:Competence protein ComEC n=1 Tax=Enterobacillus tribolii TaxID=1487935 RepID=A0A370QMJ9_9GAMM|nr:DNA internalization-related competence protein ComEC/Rec2 [Enterobacillus tribolii]MBW7982396.1 DNA internalization-related competence protein ComEC/Rec2 [Enterobacillus tribolii]RDK89562.1 competence protein ComEC [Enterobacillus tribolii]
MLRPKAAGGGRNIETGKIITALAAGSAIIGLLPVLPSHNVLLLLSLAAMLLLCCNNAPLILVALLCCGVVWGCLNAWQVMAPLRLLQPHNRAVLLRGYVISASLHDEREKIKTVFRVTHVGGEKYRVPFNVTLDWNNRQYPFCAGQRWALSVRLRAIHSRLNEGGFDGQRYAVSNGRVLQGSPVSYRAIDMRCGWRQRIIDQALQKLPSTEGRAILIALAFGERGLLSADQRRLMQDHGIAHLMAISGLHIALAALFGWGMARLGQLILPVNYNTPTFPLLLGIVCAWGYVWLSGANPPALRAGVGCTFCAVLSLCGYSMTVRQRFQWVVAAIVLYDPLTVLSQSFWLSFTAVGCLTLWYWLLPLPENVRRRRRFFPVRLLHLQLGIMLLMQPLQILLFHGVSLTALPVNMLAVPFVSFLLVPVILLGLLLQAQIVWAAADMLVSGLMSLLQPLPALWFPASGTWAAFALMLALWMMMTLLCRWRGFMGGGVAAAVILYSMKVVNVADKDTWHLHMLDVGHGLAVAIERNGKVLLYDIGNRWDGGDMATMEIIPWLRGKGLEPEGIIISHMHTDHNGGLRPLQEAYPGIWLRSPQMGDMPCIRGERWQWQGITFSALWPEKATASPGNNASCVLMLTQGRHRVLLTGDVEQAAEGALVRLERDGLRADVLQVPHHGSNTSSSALFLRTVAPQVVLSSSARYSPWRFPSGKVLERYRRQGAGWHDTAHAGQIRAGFSGAGLRIVEYRTQLIPRWYHAWFGVGGENE